MYAIDQLLKKTKVLGVSSWNNNHYTVYCYTTMMFFLYIYSDSQRKANLKDKIIISHDLICIFK